MKQELKKKLESIKSKEIISHTHTLIHSKRNHSFRKTLSISIVTSILLSNQLVLAKDITLPSGGKFVGSNGGTITSKGDTMTITGNGNGGNHVIAWGGGFNIGNGYTVNFGGSGKGYLNLDYSKNPSKIAGTLKGNGNDVFIVNPSGVIITESGKVEVGNKRFGISTTPMSNENIKAFQNSGSFSPVFKANSTRGDIINKGSINAGNVKLVGNRVILEKTFNDKKEFNQINANNINIEGKDISIDVASINGNTLNSLSAKASNKAKAYLDATGYYYNTSSWNVFDKTSGNNLTKDKYVGIGSDKDWWHFAKGTNEKEDFRNTAKEYRLTSDIDFQGNKGIGEVGKDWQNYADYCIEGLGCTSMIVGNDYDSAFTVNFDGQGYTLKNINTTFTRNYKPNYIGIFGYISSGEFKNINVNYMGGNITNDKGGYVGGFAGWIEGGTFSNITLNNIESISSDVDYNDGYVGGFAGSIEGGTFSNITLNNIGSISGAASSYVGGFTGWILESDATFSNITINNIGSIGGNRAGGFAGRIEGGTFSNITLNKIGSISISGSGSGSGSGSYVGGFAGSIEGGTFSNITLNNIGSISGRYHSRYNSSYVGGFAGWIEGGTFSNITLNNIESFSSSNDSYSNSYVGGFAGRIESGTFSNITLNNIESINGGDGSTGGFVGYVYGATLSNITLNNIESISASGDNTYIKTGGFAGSAYEGEFSNITLNNIGSISGNSSIKYQSSVGGFAGYISGGTFSNIYIYFNPNATITATSENEKAYVGKFFGNDNGNILSDKLSNIHIYYNGSKEALDNPNSIANATNDNEKPFYDNGITLHPYTDKQDGFNAFQEAIMAEGTFKDEDDNPIKLYEKQDDKGNTYFTFLDESNMDNGSNSGSNSNDNNSNSGDNGSNKDSNFIDKNKDGLNDVTLSGNDFSKDILNQILGNLNFDLLKEDAESIKQSLEFLLAFVGKDGLEQLGIFKEFALVDDNELANITQTKINNLYNALNDNLENIKKINNFNTKLEAYMGNYNAYLSGLEEWLKPELEKAYKELMALKGDMEEAYKDLQKDVGNIFFINQDYKALANNNNVRFNLASLKAIPLIPNVDKDDNQRITSPLKDINASMLDKQQVVLIKPAEEEKETLDEEKGVLNQRTCVVSENFKTNNPCMAQRI